MILEFLTQFTSKKIDSGDFYNYGRSGKKVTDGSQRLNNSVLTQSDHDSPWKEAASSVLNYLMLIRTKPTTSGLIGAL